MLQRRNDRMSTTYSLTINTFVPEEITNKLNELAPELNGTKQWDDDLHITLKSISNQDTTTSKEKAEEYSRIIEDTTKEQKPFDVTLTGISSFPNVILAKVDSNEIYALHNKLHSALPSGQPQFEGTNYIPHVSLTLCDTKEYQTKISELKELSIGTFTVKELQLVDWQLDASHTPHILKRFNLGAIE